MDKAKVVIGWLRRAANVLLQLTPRQASLISFVLLLGCYGTPLWRIELYAPQYPEGLSFSIWLSRITGDLENVNLLNHYIGMHAIEPRSIPELAYMPYVVGAFCAGLLVTALLNRRWALSIWYVAFVAGGTLGLYDFYRWGYAFGHDLSPDAPIQIPGMNYQPPFIGSKQLLNITSYSLPDVAAWLIGAVTVIALLPLAGAWWRKRQGLRPALALLVVAAILPAIGCGPVRPSPLIAGQDACDQCRMTLQDVRFGAEVITVSGKMVKFDSVTCLRRSLPNKRFANARIFLADFFAPGTLVSADEAYLARSSELRGPMGLDWVASREERRLSALPGARSSIRWTDVLAMPLQEPS